MTEIIALLTGILIAACLFAATVWSLAQIFRQRGWLRIAHTATAGTTLIIMFGLAQGWIMGPVLMSFPLLVASLGAAMLEAGWNKLLPLILLVFALALFIGIPFQGVDTSALPPVWRLT